MRARAAKSTGKASRWRSRRPMRRSAHGINAVHQEVVLCPHLTVAANHFPRRRESALRAAAAARNGTRSAEDPRRDRLQAAGRRIALLPYHRPAAIGCDRSRLDARHTVPHLRRTHRLSDAPGSRTTLRADRPAQGQGRHHRLYLATGWKKCSSSRIASRFCATDSWSSTQRHRRDQRGKADHRHDHPHDRADPSQGEDSLRRRDPRDGETHRQGLRGRYVSG